MAAEMEKEGCHISHREAITDKPISKYEPFTCVF